MKVIGITGGVGCGKSTVIDEFARCYDAGVIRADDVAKQLMIKGGSAYRQAADIFGEDILMENGEIDRVKLSGIVFNNKNKLIVLNSIIHPAVKKYILEEVTRQKLCEAHEYCLVEAALLIEDHYEVFCDEFWYIYADAQTRRKRLKESRGYSDERIDSMIKNQLSEEQFRKHCKYVIDNSGDINNTMEQIKKVLEE